MSEHRVATHLGLDASAYDVEIRRYIPGYEQMLATIVSILDRTLPAAPLVLDLGAGTGALSSAILVGIPRARVQLIDIDPAMLEVARSRVAPFGDRAELRQAAFADPLPPCDAVVASLALHHIADVDAKRETYQRIHRALRPGGALLLGDATVHADGPERTYVFEAWTAHMASHGISTAEAHALYAQWGKEDSYLPLPTELSLLASAGFRHPDCFWKHVASTVYGGFV